MCSYYPLFPPALGTMLDTTLNSSLALSGCPDILILPSDLNCFAKPTTPVGESQSSALCINPGRLARGGKAGSYARIQVLGQSGRQTDIQQRCKIEICQI